MNLLLRLLVVVIAFVAVAEVLVVAKDILFNAQRPPVESLQHGFRGTGLVQLYNPRTREELRASNEIPGSVPYAGDEGAAAGTVYENVEVLTDVSVGEFTRLMVNMTNWVARDEGCAGCHDVSDFADDTLYTKVVARRMLEMVRHINSEWTDHVSDTGVTCYTCHRGKLVPPNIWHRNPGPKQAGGMAQKPAGKNHPSVAAGGSALPLDPFTMFLEGDREIRIQSETALPAGNDESIKQAKKTYALMMHFSDALGVNCDYCHNTRTFFDWAQSPPQRVTAWHGIRMVRDLNNDYLVPLLDVFPQKRLGELGDAPKVNCATCHNGVNKPLFGTSMLKDFPELSGVPAEAANAVPPPTP